MKNKTRLKLILYMLLFICILASFTYVPSDAKYYKEEENALLYKAKFNQMGGYYIDDTSTGMGVQNDSTATNIHYKFNFIRSEDMKDGEVDTYSLTLPDASCYSTIFDGNSNIDASSISFNTLVGMGNSIIVNLTCPVNKVINNDTINLSIKVKQQFTNEREYEYATGLFSVDADKYLEDKIDRLEDNNIYLIKSNQSDIYNRFVKLLKEYIHNNEESFNEALSDYLKDSHTLDSLLEEYMASIFITSTDNITINDLTKISGITIGSDTSYNELIINDLFKTDFKRYFDLRDYIEGNTIKLSKLNTENVEQRIENLIASYDKNININEINLYIRDNLEESKRVIPSEYASINGLNYSDTNTHSIIIIEPNFSSYVKTYYYNKDQTAILKNFYFLNDKLSSAEINTLFFEYLDRYFYKKDSNEYKTIKNYLESQFDANTDNVIALAKKINRDYFRYETNTHAIQLNSRLYDTIINGDSYVVQKHLSLSWKVQRLRTQLESNINDSTIIDAILNDSKFLSIIDVTTGTAIDTMTNIISGTNNIELKITSGADDRDIVIKITITTIVNQSPIIDESNNDILDTPIEEDSSTSEVIVTSPNEEVSEKELPEEEGKTTNPTVEKDIQTQDEVGIITYPLTPLEEERKNIYLKPEDE